MFRRNKKKYDLNQEESTLLPENENSTEELLSTIEPIETMDDNQEDYSLMMHLPSHIVIGYYEGMTAKGLKEYINGYVFKYFNAPNVTYYKMLKHNKGYIFEIHDGDNKTSYLKKILELFNNGENIVYLKTQNRIAKVINTYHKVETYILPEADTLKHPNAILPEKGKMKSIVTKGFGFISFGLSIAFLGVTSLFLSSVFKHILNKKEDFIVPKQNIEAPFSYIEKLPDATESSYVSKVWFENNQWNKKETTIQNPDNIQKESSDKFIAKLDPYKSFVQKCHGATNSFKDCSDSNTFLDKINPLPEDNVKSLSLKEGTIYVDFNYTDKEGKELKVQIVPELRNNQVTWTSYCSNVNLVSNCVPIQVKLPAVEIKSETLPVEEKLSINKIEKTAENLLEEKHKIKNDTKTIKSTNKE